MNIATIATMATRYAKATANSWTVPRPASTAFASAPPKMAAVATNTNSPIIWGMFVVCRVG